MRKRVPSRKEKPAQESVRSALSQDSFLKALLDDFRSAEGPQMASL